MAARAKARILIADDESLYRLMMKSMLQTILCDVVGEAKDGEEAVELYRSLKPDFALLDINMPRMSGDNALRTIKAEFPGARVIMMTSMADVETVKTCLTLGAIQYIRKDTQPADIKALIQKILQQAPPAAQGDS
jgi:two-component system chemotaxis response regulator CheY